MKEQIESLHRKIQEQINNRAFVHKMQEENIEARKNNTEERVSLDEAQIIIQQAAQLTQQQLEYHISELVTLALESVFDDPYKLRVVFETKRGKTEAHVYFEDRNGNAVEPLDASGGGAVDVASFALQVSLWSLGNPKTSPVLILDEPLKWLKGGSMPDKGAALLKEISSRLGIQIIMVSHSDELIESSDNLVRVQMKNRVSSIKH